MLYFSAPFCDSVATRVGKCFVTILTKNFKRDHTYSKFLTVKLLKCMPNMKKTNYLTQPWILKITEKNKGMCDFRKQKCLFDGKCLTGNLIYLATVKTKKA